MPVRLDLKPALTGTLAGGVIQEVIVSTEQAGDPAIACTLGVDELGTQAQRWMRLGREAGLGREETADGLRLRFRDQPGAEQELRALVAVESDCCSWARWEVHRADGELIMQASSTPEGAAALKTMFNPRP